MAFTKTQLEALKNALLASNQPITAPIHREFAQKIIDELYDAQSRANLLSAIQNDSSLLTTDSVFVIRNGQGFLIPSSQVGGTGSLANLTDTVIIDPQEGDVIIYNSITEKWENRVAGVVFNDFYVRHDIDNQGLDATQKSNATTNIGAQSISEKGQIDGYASLDGTGRVPSSQLPSFVDDVLEFPTLGDFPTTGESGKIYIALDTNVIYRWSGSSYVEISASLVLGETSTTAYRGDRGKIAYDYSQIGHLPLTGGTLASSGSTNTLNINHASGSGLALNITKGGNGEGLKVVKTSGSGLAASITGGVTLLDELNLTTKLADAHIASASTWNAKIGGTIESGQVAFGTGSGVIGGDSGLFWNNVNKMLGIGNTNPNVPLTITAPTGSDSTSLGSELLTSTNWTTTGWTGDFIAGFTHTPGNTDVLSHTLAAVNAVLYVIQYTITNRTAGGITITFGGKSQFATGTNKFGLRATTTGNFTITPTSDFNGTVVLSVKVANIYPALISIVNSSGGSQPVEIRATQNASNTFMGYRAGARNLGVSNTVYGYYSLDSNSTGAYITTIGSRIFSGASFSGNIYNVGIGGDIGNSNFTGGINTFIGWNIGAESITTTASSNIAIGYMAFRGNGNSNTIIGNHINRPTGSFSQNVNIGDQSMFSHTTGDQNTSLGFRAGRYIADGTTANTISNNSVFLGSGTRALADNQTNQIVIGHNAIGLGSNSVVLGNDSITFTGLKGNVGVNTTTDAGFRLDVNGTARIVGATRIDNLAGTGTRMVVADANGVMSTQALGIGGSGTLNRLAKFTAAGTVGDSGIFESGGNVGIGTDSPTNFGNGYRTLELSGTTGGGVFRSSSNSVITEIYSDASAAVSVINVRNNNPLIFLINSSERMRITSGGNVLIGTQTDAGFRLDVNGTGRFKASAGTYAGGSLILTSSAGTNPIYLTSNGGYFALSNGGSGDHLLIASTGAATFSSSVTATAFFTSSDKRKKDIISQDGDLATYRFKGDDQIHYGYIAQDMQALYPNQVSKGTDGMLSLNYIEILVKKVHDLETKLKRHGLD
jgi:hypothetical protein